MATAQASFIVQDINGRIQCINVYCPDTSNTACRFDESKVAVSGSPDAFTAKAKSSLIDVVLTSDVATPTSIQILVDGKPTGDILDCTAHLASVVRRPRINLGLAAGQKLQATMV